MRQFSYLYKSYMINKHGYYTYLPHAKLFHPYFGMETIGTFYDSWALYHHDWIKFFKDNYSTIGKKNKKLEFRQKVKIFFPEVRKGVVYLDKLSFTVDSDPIDEVSVSYRIETNSKLYDYIEIKHHLAEFEIVYETDREYLGLNKPFEIKCDYIDLMLFNQRISITITENTIKCVPYVAAYKTDTPMFYLERFNTSATEMTNTSLKYTLIFDESAKEFLSKFNTQLIQVRPYMNPGRTTTNKYYLCDINAYSTKFALSTYMIDKQKDDPNFLPMFSNESILDTCTLNKYQSPWYYKGIYKDKFCCFDYPGVSCDKCDCNHSADETRGDVWNYIMCNMHYTDKELVRKIHTDLDSFAQGVCTTINSLYKRKPLYLGLEKLLEKAEEEYNKIIGE